MFSLTLSIMFGCSNNFDMQMFTYFPYDFEKISVDIHLLQMHARYVCSTFRVL